MDWWQVLIMAFAGGFVGGTVAWHLEMRSRITRLPREERDDGGASDHQAAGE